MRASFRNNGPDKGRVNSNRGQARVHGSLGEGGDFVVAVVGCLVLFPFGFILPLL